MTTSDLIAEARRLGEPSPGDGWRRLLWELADALEAADRAADAAWRYHDHQRRVSISARCSERGVPANGSPEMDVRMSLLREAMAALEAYRAGMGEDTGESES